MINLYLLAIGFFTRIPVPHNLQYTEELLNRSASCYALAGVTVALFLCPLLYLYQLLFQPEIAALLLTASSLIITGAFHEDGFADMCDGFGGAFTPEKKLEIMKDSRIGTFGGSALFMELSLSTVCYMRVIEYSPLVLSLLLISAHAISRSTSGCIIKVLPYMRKLDSKAKAKPLATGMRTKDLIFLILSGLLFCAPLSWEAFAVTIIICLTVFFWSNNFLKRHLGGFTGDCLGAVQIITYLALFLSYTVFIRYNIPLINYFTLGLFK